MKPKIRKDQLLYHAGKSLQSANRKLRSALRHCIERLEAGGGPAPGSATDCVIDEAYAALGKKRKRTD